MYRDLDVNDMRVTKSNEISFLNSGQCSVCAGHNVTVCACVHACVCVCVCERERDRQTERQRERERVSASHELSKLGIMILFV